jgi:VIT1/CCC1 family predicted Fe2+/Mn2+ transporter
MYLYSPLYGMIGSALAALAVGAAFSAWYEKNQIVKAVVWNVGLGVLALGVAHFTIKFLLTS